MGEFSASDSSCPLDGDQCQPVTFYVTISGSNKCLLLLLLLHKRETTSESCVQLVIGKDGTAK